MDVGEYRRPLQVAGLATGIAPFARSAYRLYRAARRSGYRFRSGNTRSRFEGKLGPMPLKRRNMGPLPPAKRKRVTIQDEGGYTQFRQFKYKGGRKRSVESKRRSILNSIITRQRLRYSRINELSAGVGSIYLKHGIDDATYNKLPLYIFNVTNVRQGDTSFKCPFYGLRINTVTNKLVWSFQGALAADGVTPVNDWQYEDSEGSNTQVGRKSFLDWFRVRLTLWGKKNAPSKVSLMLVSLPDEIYCPEYQDQNVGLQDEADAFWKQQMKPLINNPASGNILTVYKKMKVLRSWVFNFDPTSTTESDADPHCKSFDFFHRLGRLINYAKYDATPVTSAQLDSSSAYADGGLAKSIGTYPNPINRSLYFVIKSMQQDKVDAPSNGDTASFDFNFQVCHRTVQPNFT